jgi:hypothetical protein
MTQESTNVEIKRVRRGPKSRLDEFQPPSGPAMALSDKFLNDSQWFARYGGFMVRHSHGDEGCADDLEIDEDTAEQIQKHLEALSKTAVADHFVTCSESGKKIPPFPREDSFLAANAIGRALIEAAEQSPGVVRNAVCAYACGVRRSDKRLVLADPRYAELGRAIIDTVHGMGLKTLRWRIVGFKSVETDETPQVLPKYVAPEWCERLGIRPNTRISWVSPKNKKNAANAAQIAVEVVEQRGGLLEISSNFHLVMLVAAVVLFPESIKQSIGV